MPILSTPPPRPFTPSERHFIVACSAGDSVALEQAARLRSKEDYLTVAHAGLLAALNGGHSALACELLAAFESVRPTLHHSKTLLVAASRPGKEAVLNAMLSRHPTLEARAHALFTCPALSPAARAALIGSDARVLPRALKLGLEEGKTGVQWTETLLRHAPDVHAPALLDVLVSYVAKLPSAVDKFPLADLFRFAALLRPMAKIMRPRPPPSWPAISAVLQGAERSESEWAFQWVEWMLPFDTLAQGEPWSALLHLHPMSAPAREAFWMVLAARLAGDGIDTVSPTDRPALLRALTAETLTQQRIPRDDGGFRSWPAWENLSRFAAKDPLNVFLIAWRASAYPELVTLAVEADNDPMIQRLVGFGADLNQRMPDGNTLLQDVALHRRSLSRLTGNVRTNWSVNTSQDESIAHLLFKKSPFDNDEADAGGLRTCLDLLKQFALHLPASVWIQADATGQTPWAALMAFRARWCDTKDAQSEFARWSEQNPMLVRAMEAGDLHQQLSRALPEVHSPSAPVRRRM